MEKITDKKKLLRAAAAVLAAAVLAAVPAGPAVSVSSAAVKSRAAVSVKDSSRSAIKKQSIAKLKSYIKTHGHRTDSGGRYIGETTYQYGDLTKYYAETTKKGSLYFTYYSTGGLSRGMNTVTCRYYSPYKKARITVTHTDSSASYTSQLVIRASKYNCDKTYKFKVLQSKGFSRSRVRKGSSMNASIAFLEWDSLLISRVDLDMNKIGFYSMKY
jgi:hypothetical protein